MLSRFVYASFLVLLLSCGRSADSPEFYAKTYSNTELKKQNALDELTNLEKPEALSEAIWNEILARFESDFKSIGADRNVSRAPLGEANRVDDIELVDYGGGDVRLEWSYINAGDYDQNGEVGIPDITPIALHYGHAKDGFESWPDASDEIIDGDGNGEIGIPDVTTIALNYLTNVTGYSIETSSSPEGPWNEVGFAGHPTPLSEGKTRYSVPVPPLALDFIRLLPRDGVGELGEPSTIFSLAADAPPVVLSISRDEGLSGELAQFSALVVGTQPITVEWNFGGAATPNNAEGTFVEATLGAAGEYSITITATNNFGFDEKAFPFTIAGTGVAPEIVGVSPTTLDRGIETSIVASITGSQPMTYLWNFGGAATPNESTMLSPVIMPGTIGSYSAFLEVENAFGIFRFDFAIDVVPAPGDEPSISEVSPLGGREGNAVTFGAVTGGLEPLSYLWDFGGGAVPNTSISAAPQITLGSQGEYNASLTVSNMAGEATFSFTLTVLKDLGAQWVRSWGAEKQDGLNGISIDSLGNVYASGFTYSFSELYSDVLLMKYSMEGTLLWARNWGTDNKQEYANDCEVDALGGIYVVGSVYDSITEDSQALILKFAPNGDVVWQRTWGGEWEDTARKVGIDSGGFIYVAGETYSFGEGDADAFLLKYSTTGNLVWQRTWGGMERDGFRSLCVNSEDGIFAVGNAKRQDVNTFDAVIAKFDFDGEIVWQRAWNAGFWDILYDAKTDSDGNLIVCGETDAYEAGGADGLLLKIDSNGEILFEKYYAGSTSDIFSGVAVAANGTIFVAGSMDTDRPEGYNITIHRYTSAGELIADDVWSGVYNGWLNGAFADAEGRVFLSGTAFDSLGIWQQHGGELKNAAGTIYDAWQVTGTPDGIEETPSGSVKVSVGTENTGGGNNDAILFKMNAE